MDSGSLDNVAAQGAPAPAPTPTREPGGLPSLAAPDLAKPHAAPAVIPEPPSITPADQLPQELLDAAQGKAPPLVRAAHRFPRPDLKGAALCALQEHGTLGVAAKAIGISRRTLYTWREEDEEFGLEVKDVEEYCTDLIEHRMWKQAQSGDTIAAIFMLKGRRPKVWHDKARLEVSGPGGGPVPVQVDDKERADLLATAKALREAKGSTEASE